MCTKSIDSQLNIAMSLITRYVDAADPDPIIDLNFSHFLVTVDDIPQTKSNLGVSE